GNSTLRSVTIKQILHAQTDEASRLLIDGQEVKNICIVGRVEVMRASASHTFFSVTDGTGTIEVRRWLQQNQAGAAASDAFGDGYGDGFDAEAGGAASGTAVETIATGMYVSIVGTLRESEGRKNMTTNLIKPVTQMDQLTFHFLQAVLEHQIARKGLPALRGAKATDAGAGGAYGQAQVVTAESVDQQENLWSALDPVQRRVLTFARQQESTGSMADSGTHIDEVIMHLRAHHSADEVRNAVARLSTEGVIYATIDQNHFK
ncbi:hypothetical protein CXG81DRAFT_7924, partial [Caulochytrium protostelioides]